jgi:hypothetical protein
MEGGKVKGGGGRERGDILRWTLFLENTGLRLLQFLEGCGKGRPGSRSALDWILDQHKGRKPKDPAIAEKLNIYRFADHKEKVVDLIARVTRVSVETVAITQAMRGARR